MQVGTMRDLQDNLKENSDLIQLTLNIAEAQFVQEYCQLLMIQSEQDETNIEEENELGETLKIIFRVFPS